jgi:penicillin-binding protein 1A
LSVPGYSVAVKTGTTNSNRDAWIVGYNPRIAVGVWSGNNDNTVMKKGGAQVSGPLFNKVMLKYLSTGPEMKALTSSSFPRPRRSLRYLRGSLARW